MQRGAGQHIFDEVRRWCRSDGSTPPDGGLSQLVALLSQKLQDEGGMTRQDAYAMATDAGHSVSAPDAHGVATATIELSAGNVALPKVAGHIALEPPAMPQTLADILREDRAFIRAHPPDRLEPCFTSVADWPQLAIELLERGLCCLMAEAEGVTFHGHRVSAGLFGVPKKQTASARLIIDRRPQNSLEVSLRRVVMDRVLSGVIDVHEGLHLTELMTLPFFAQFQRLMLSSSSELHITMEDAENYYYHMLLPRTLQRTNAIGPLLPSSVLPQDMPAVISARAQYGPQQLWSLHMLAPPMEMSSRRTSRRPSTRMLR
eukprot:3833319-Amphidinium_carterae.2